MTSSDEDQYILVDDCALYSPIGEEELNELSQTIMLERNGVLGKTPTAM